MSSKSKQKRKNRPTILPKYYPTATTKMLRLPLKRTLNTKALKRCLFSTTASDDHPDVALLLERSTCGLFATLTLNRPATHNALSQGVIDGFYKHLDTLQHEQELPRAVFLRAAGGKTFCAGGDLKKMRASGGQSRAANTEEAMHLSGIFAALRSFPRPVIAMVDGPCFGGGVGIISSCDMAFATSESTFALSEVLLGVIPATISPFVIDRIGASAASRYFLTAERFDATEAKRIGLLHDVVGNLDDMEASLRTSIGRCSPMALGATKELISHVSHTTPLQPGLRESTAEYLADVRESVDGQEGMTAFIEKRKPNWFV
jgi:methylglutaconyl-CoA hydratase